MGRSCLADCIESLELFPEMGILIDLLSSSPFIVTEGKIKYQEKIFISLSCERNFKTHIKDIATFSLVCDKNC
jgi:hypothetical protein